MDKHRFFMIELQKHYFEKVSEIGYKYVEFAGFLIIC